MTEIIKVFADKTPPMRFIGKKYTDYSHWGEWFQNGWFDIVEAAMNGVESITKLWENGGGYVGVEKREHDTLREYWIGMFTPADTPVPEGFAAFDVPAAVMGTCWIYGKEEEVHSAIGGCREALCHCGIQPKADSNGYIVSFENGLCPRFTTPDEKGNVILDYCYFA